MEIIIPAAGLFTRFSTAKPKYLLTDYKGKLMLFNALKPFLGKYNITIGILQEHEDKFNITEVIKREVGDINVVVLKERTRGPAETVYRILKQTGITGEILIKDCDSFFDYEYQAGNVVCTSNLKEYETLNRVGQKSFVVSNDQNIIQDIVEKEIVSSDFCVGGYQFESAQDFIDVFESLNEISKEIFVSHIIQELLERHKVFVQYSVKNYVDVGTLEEWNEFNDKPTVFCDIDGTIIKSQQRPHNTPYEILPGNIEVIKKLRAKGCQIIFTTSRASEFMDVTKKMLSELGFNDCTLIMGLHNSKRILINDYHPTNQYPSAVSYQIPRDADILSKQL